MKRDAWLPFGRTEGDEDTPSIDTAMPISQQRQITRARAQQLNYQGNETILGDSTLHSHTFSWKHF